MMSAKLNIGLTAWLFGTSGLAREFAEQAEIAEGLGFHSFWLPENHFGDANSIPSPLMLLASVAARTQAIGLGSTSYLLPIRHPLLAAEEVAVLDRLSGGRVILGVGRGVQDAMFRAFEIDAKDKRRVFKTNLDVMIKAWRGEPVMEAGTEAQATILAPLPVQQPHPPIWIAAFGPLALKQAGLLGLPYLASPVETLDKLVSNYASHRGFAKEAGHGSIDVVPIMRTLFVSDDAREVAQVKDTLTGSGMHSMREESALVDDWTIVGDRHYVKDKITEYVELLGMTHLIARGRIPGVDNERQVKCLEQLAQIGNEVSINPQS